MSSKKSGDSTNPIDCDDEDGAKIGGNVANDEVSDSLNWTDEFINNDIPYDKDKPSFKFGYNEDDATSKYTFIPTREEYYDFIVHHRGKIVIHPDSGLTEYVGGDVSTIEGIDPDYVCYTELCKCVMKLGYASVPGLYYAIPGPRFLLNSIVTNRDINELCGIARENGQAHIYLEHGIDEILEGPVVLSLTYPNFSQNEDGNDDNTIDGDNVNEVAKDSQNVNEVENQCENLNEPEKGSENLNEGEKESENQNEGEKESENVVQPLNEGEKESENQNEGEKESENVVQGEKEIENQNEGEKESDNLNERGNETQKGYESDESLILTDDEEYLNNREKAKEIMKGKKKVVEGTAKDKSVEDHVLENEGEDNGLENENLGDHGRVHDADYYELDIGTDFKRWESNSEDESHSDYDPLSSSDEDDWVEQPRAKKTVEVNFNANVPIKEFNFCKDMIFESNEQLKDQIRAYAAANGYSIHLPKNDKQRVLAKCLGCPWRLFASWKDSTLKIKSYQKNHMCSMNLKTKTAANSKWLAKQVGDQIRMAPFSKLKDIKELIKKDVRVEVTLKMAKRVKIRALEEVKQSLVEHYSKLWNYVQELDRTNHGSTIILKSSGEEWSGPPEFRRFYICFDAVKKGFREGCRKFVGVDGCFLKTWVKGELLVAMGRDPNNQMFPICWAVVEKEDQFTWGWFLGLLNRDIGIGDGSGWTLMSDQQKGLELAVKNMFPEIEHRNCARHIYANFRKRGFTGVNYRKGFWAVSKSTTEYNFNKNMEKIKKLSEAAYQHLMDRDPTRWCKAFFPTDRLCDAVDNNMCESFNYWILESRYKPLISMLEEIRKQVMVRMGDKQRLMAKRLSLGRKFGHRIYEKLQDSIKNSADCNALWNGQKEFEIIGGKGGYTVNLNERTCSCRAWQLCGIPCCHAVCAITHSRESPEDYIDECFKGETYLKVYGNCMKPLNGKPMWPSSDRPVLLPPPLRMLKGRPGWNRRRDPLEDGKGKGKASEEGGSTQVQQGPEVEEDPFKVDKLTRKGIKMTCSICKEQGHNKRGCPKKPIEDNASKEKESASKENPKKRKATGDRSETASTKKKGKGESNKKASGSGQGQNSGQNQGNQNGVGDNAINASFTRNGRSYVTTNSLVNQSKGPEI